MNTLPTQWHFDAFKNVQGNDIRYGWNCPDNPKALIIIAEGRTECIEEYFEFINDMNKRGFACAIMDWQGQGLSYRYKNDHSRHHSHGFDRDLDDFDQFLKIIHTIEPLQNLSQIFVAHSMGGHLMTRYLIEKSPPILCAVMIAPMMGLLPKRFIKYMARPILATMKKLNRLEKHGLGQHPWSPKLAELYKKILTSDPERASAQPNLFTSYPELICGGVTYGWIESALNSIETLNNHPSLSSTQTPLLFCIGGKEKIVDNAATTRLSKKISSSVLVEFKDSQHQIHRERDDIRNEFLNVFDRFIEKYLPS